MSEGRRTSPPPSARAELRDQLNHHAHRYYVLGDPEIGDDGYDALRPSCEALERRAPRAGAARLADSEGRRQGAMGRLEKAEHRMPLLSLGKAYQEAELQAWVDRMQQGTSPARASRPRIRFAVEPKIDGEALSRMYRKRVARPSPPPAATARRARTSPTPSGRSVDPAPPRGAPLS